MDHVQAISHLRELATVGDWLQLSVTSKKNYEALIGAIVSAYGIDCLRDEGDPGIFVVPVRRLAVYVDDTKFCLDYDEKDDTVRVSAGGWIR